MIFFIIKNLFKKNILLIYIFFSSLYVTPLFSEDASKFQYDVFVSPNIKDTVYEKVAVLPFKSPTELSGTSISDFFTTEILKTYKYQLIERSQIENIFKEQEMNLSGVTDSTVAIEVGKILGVNATIIGTVSEYGYQQYKASKLPSVGINVRMIDTTTGKIVWSISDSQVASSGRISLSQHAKNIVGNMVAALIKACRDVGDFHATALPVPGIYSYRGGVREAFITVNKSTSKLISYYELLRSNYNDKGYISAGILPNTKKQVIFKDNNLLDSTMYFYKVRAVSKDKLVSPATEAVQIITQGPPPPPRDVNAEGGKLRQIPLSWKVSEDPFVKGYIIFRKTGSEPFKKITVIKKPDINSYLDKESRKNPIEDNTEYTYHICSFNCVAVKSKPSKEVKAVTLALPVKIENLKAESNMVKSVKLTWDISPEPQIAGYNIYRFLDKKNVFKKIKTIKGRNTTTYLDYKKGSSSLKDGSKYSYRVAAFYRKDAEGEKSDTADAVTKPVPEKVKNLSVSDGEIKQITITWEKNPESDIRYYVIYKGKKEQRLKKLNIVSAEQQTYIDKDLKDGIAFYYAVAAIDKDELLGEQSFVLQGKTKPVPQIVKGLSGKVIGTDILLSWAENPEADIAHYQIYSKKTFLNKTEQNSWFFTKGEPGKRYYFTVIATDEDNLSSKPCKKIKIKIPKA